MSYRFAIITPYYKESMAYLRQCYESVKRQDLEVDHYFVADGFPLEAIDDWDCKHLILPQAHGDSGNTPRGVGSILADAGGYDFIGYLDADNWFHDDHLKSLLQLWKDTQAPVLCSARTYHRLDGALMKVTEPDEDNFHHVDTSCFLIHKSAVRCVYVWNQMPKPLGPVCDRIFLKAVKHLRYPIQHSRQRTVAFRSQYADHYIRAGETVPEEVKGFEVLDGAAHYMLSTAGAAECVERLGFLPYPY